jgi:hypothetical protein
LGGRHGEDCENDGRGEFNYDIFDRYVVRTFVNATMYPQLNNNKKKLVRPHLIKQAGHGSMCL